MLRIVPLLLVLMLLAPAGAHALDDILSLELWAETETPIQDTDEYPISTETAVSRLLEETRYVVSGMIYGFRYRYQPADPRRGVQEVFELEPVSSIPWGDENLAMRNTRREESRIFVSFLYELNDYQRQLQQSWASAAIDDSSGRGEASIMQGNAGRLEAIQASIQHAVRRHLQFLTRNRPRSSQGDLILERVPRLSIESGQWVARADIRLIVGEIQSHTSY